MTSSIVRLLAVATTLVTMVQGSYLQPDLFAALPFKAAMTYAQRNNSLVMFGGEDPRSSYTNNLQQLTQTPNGFTWQSLQQQNPPPGSLYGQAVISKDGSTLFQMGGQTSQTVNQLVPLQVYKYTFGTQSWQAFPSTAANGTAPAAGAGPLNRNYFSATYSNNKIYIFGGAVNISSIFVDMWMLDPATSQYTQLPNQNVPRYGHTASLLSNGKIVMLGGVMAGPNNQFSLMPMNRLQVFDTSSGQWDAPVNVSGPIPSARTSHSAAVTSDDKIVIFGGDDGASSRQRRFINSVAILDTKTWSWVTLPDVSGDPPGRRSLAAAGILDDTHFTVAFGEATNLFYKDINVLDMKQNAWIKTFNDSNSSDSVVSTGLIVGVTIAGVVLLAIFLLLLWRFRAYVGWLVSRIHADIWKPRSGEPIWAETTRIIFQVFFLFIFALFLAFVIRQAITSPNVTQRIQEPAAQVEVPDVRFCFDGYPTYANADPRNPGVTCQTDNGFPCTSYISPLNLSLFMPAFSDNLGPLNCFIFRTGDNFKLTATSGVNNGSRLLFNFYGDQSITAARVHVSVYPKKMDPNVKVFNIQDDIPSLLSPIDIASWQNAEWNDIQVTNVYTIQPFTYSALGYDLVDHKYLQPVGWNYVGFLPISNSTPEITSNFRQESPNPTYAQQHLDIGFFALFPNEFALLTDREVKVYTLVNALGFVGGIFGLLLAAQTWLFGYRPQSPWGVVHRWSVGDMRQSLLDGLRSKFRTTESGIPLVHPIRSDVCEEEYASPEVWERKRISNVEERMQVLELLFKAYYVNDEVFRSLDNANRQPQGIRLDDSGMPLYSIPKDNTTIHDNH